MRARQPSFHRHLIAWQREQLDYPVADLPGLLHRYCRFLHAQGMPIFRAMLVMNTLHPQVKALAYAWCDQIVAADPFPSPALVYRRFHRLDGCSVDEARMHAGARNNTQFERSPFQHLLASGRDRLSLRMDPSRASKPQRFPVLDDLMKHGATHYVAFRLHRVEGMLSVVTREPDGFSRLALNRLADSLVVLAGLLDSAIKDVVLDTVLRCYLGSGPAHEIRRGNISPGRMLDMHGAIWFSDLRGYSALSRQLLPQALVSLLNQYYAVLVEAIHAEGGDILKFIGDAVLAIFPVSAKADAGPGRACQQALAAFEAAKRGLQAAKIDLRHGVGLHLGRFQFGNIGNHRRVDFTVIGDAVNFAARIEAQCSVQRCDLLMSTDFAKAAAVPKRKVAEVALKGIAGTHVLHTLLSE